MKKVKIHTPYDTFETFFSKVEYKPWGVEFIVEDEFETKKVGIPFASITQIEEIISQVSPDDN